MSSRRGHLVGLSAGLLLALTTACSGTTTPEPNETASPEAPARTHWELRHRVIDSPGIEVTEQWLADQEEGTSVALVSGAAQQREDCSVAVGSPAGPGPENMVGEKIKTTFKGRPAVRNGVDAEGDYLMWQSTDQSWVTVSCSEEDSRESIDRVAAAVDLEPTTIRVPVDLEIPDGVRPSLVSVDLANSSARIYLDPTRTSDRGDLVIMVEDHDRSERPGGESTTIAGRSAVIDDSEISPVIWVQEQGTWIYVGASTSDTGPYPDRSGELPIIRTLAESLSFARDLSDPTTWFPAEDVFG